MADEAEAIKLANESGFPLQIAVAQQVKDTAKQHGWSVRYTEHSWVNQNDEKSGFIDIVLEKRPTNLIVECKRANNSTWVFLPGDGDPQPKRMAKGWHSDPVATSGWRDLSLYPECPEVTYCAVAGQANDGRRLMLERICGELLSATEAFAFEHVGYFAESVGQKRRFYFNVVVTTAELKIAQFQPGAISLTDGMLDKATTTAKDVPYVRFRKQMLLRERRFTPSDYGNGIKPDQEKENTVFVVRATALVDFLTAFELAKENFSPFA